MPSPSRLSSRWSPGPRLDWVAAAPASASLRTRIARQDAGSPRRCDKDQSIRGAAASGTRIQSPAKRSLSSTARTVSRRLSRVRRAYLIAAALLPAAGFGRGGKQGCRLWSRDARYVIGRRQRWEFLMQLPDVFRCALARLRSFSCILLDSSVSAGTNPSSNLAKRCAIAFKIVLPISDFRSRVPAPRPWLQCLRSRWPWPRG